MIEKCSNFKREFTREGKEINFCTVTASNMTCAGLSDFCPIPDKFIPIRNVGRETILFKDDPNVKPFPPDY